MLTGGRRSTRKGRGLDFDQIREYQAGDDVRCIDWPGSARAGTGTLLVRQYMHESSRVLLLAVDISSSLFFSSGIARKYDTTAQVAVVISLIADYGGDAIGLFLFSDEQELYIRPGKGRAHVQKLIRILCTYAPKGKSTSFDAAYKKIIGLAHKDMIVVCISDFIGIQDTLYVRAVAHAHTMIAIRCLDQCEQTLPAIGYISMVDPETEQLVTVDMRASSGAQVLLRERLMEQNTLFARYNTPVLDVTSDKDFIHDMVRFFKRSM